MSTDAHDRWPAMGYWVRVAVALLVVYALSRMVVAVQGILILLLVAMILSIGLQPSVNWLVRKGMKRGPAVAAIFFSGVLVVGGFLALITPTIVGQIQELVRQAPDYLRRAQAENGFIADLNQRFDLIGKLQSLAQSAPSTALALIKSFTSFIFSLLTVLILTLYFTTGLPRMSHGFAQLLRRDDREDFERILAESTQRVGGYMMGNVVISIFAGVLSFIALIAIGVPYPAALGFWVALADLIPTVGAYVGLAPAAIVAGFDSIPKLVATLVFFLVYQQVENYVIAPRVMTKAVEMSAAAVIVSVLIGGTLAGFAGALLALPAAVIIKVTIQQLYVKDRLAAVREADAAPAE